MINVEIGQCPKHTLLDLANQALSGRLWHKQAGATKYMIAAGRVVDGVPMFKCPICGEYAKLEG